MSVLTDKIKERRLKEKQEKNGQLLSEKVLIEPLIEKLKELDVEEVENISETIHNFEEKKNLNNSKNEFNKNEFIGYICNQINKDYQKKIKILEEKYSLRDMATLNKTREALESGQIKIGIEELLKITN